MTAVSPASHPPPAPFEPQEISPGVFGATFYSRSEPLFLRMELLTGENARNWTRYLHTTSWVVDSMGDGVLNKLVELAGTDACPFCDQIKDQTGFTEGEYNAFITKAIHQKQKTAGKIVRFLTKITEGSASMCTAHTPGEFHYIAYITKNPGYSVPYMEDLTLKNYIGMYGDVVISLGSDFTKESTFHNRGISRNPYWVFQGKYEGLSMLLHGFTGAVAEKYFPRKRFMEVRPVGSMQCILQKSLLTDEGYVENVNGIRTDVTNLECSVNDGEHHKNIIAISALTRIYRKATASLNMRMVRNQAERCSYPLAI